MKLNVAVVFGGKSTEHEISIITALQAVENIDKDKYNVLVVYIDKNGDFYYSNAGLLNDSKNFSDTKSLLVKCELVNFIKEKKKVFIKSLNNKFLKKQTCQQVDIVFPIVHGTNVEDGNLQGYFHTFDLPVVGPDCLSAAVSMDKYLMKMYCKAIGVPVLDAIKFDKEDYKDVDKIVSDIEREFKYPVIIKPVNLGSSIGISKTDNKEKLLTALELAFSFSNVILVEPAVVNLREFNCAVVGDRFNCELSEIEEPFGNDEILSFADKYLSGKKYGKVGSGSKGKLTNSTGKISDSSVGSKSGMASLKRKIPADISTDLKDEINENAIKIFKNIGLSGVARIDFIYDTANSKVYANEVNAVPGSLSYYLFEPKGIKYKELLDKLIKIALDNYKAAERLNFTFESNVLK